MFISPALLDVQFPYSTIGFLGGSLSGSLTSVCSRPVQRIHSVVVPATDRYGASVPRFCGLDSPAVPLI